MGLPFVVLNMVSVLMFKGMGIGRRADCSVDVAHHDALDAEVPLESVP